MVFALALQILFTCININTHGRSYLITFWHIFCNQIKTKNYLKYYTIRIYISIYNDNDNDNVNLYSAHVTSWSFLGAVHIE